MLRFTRLYGENVGTFRKFDLPLDDQGFVLVSGQTGAGKSTLFSLIPFLLFGQTARDGKSRTSFQHPNRKGMLAAVEFEAHGHQWKVWQARDHKEQGTGLWISSDGGDKSPYTEADTRAKIKEVVGMEFEDFCTAIYLPQGSAHLMIDGSDADRWSYMAALSGCSVLEQAADRVKPSADEVAKPKAQAEAWRSTLDRLREKRKALPDENELLVTLDSMAQEAESLAEAVDKIESKIAALSAKRDKAAKIEALEAEAESAPAEPPKTPPEALEARLDRLRAYQSRYTASMKALEAVEALSGAEDFDHERKTECIRLIAASEVEVSNAKSELEALSGVGAVCGQCGQTVSVEHIKSKRRSLSKSIRDGEATLASLRAEVAALSKAEKAHAERSRLMAKVDPEAKTDKAHLVESVAERLREARKHQAEYDRGRSILARLEGLRAAVGDDTTATLAKRISRLTGQRDEAMQRMTDVTDRLAKVEAEVDGWRAYRADRKDAKARLSEAESSLEQNLLRLQVSAGLQELKRRRVETVAATLVEFAGQYLSGTGEDRLKVELGQRKFGIEVERSDKEGKRYTLPAKRLSGGERDRLSAAFIFASQAVNRSRKRTNLLVLDEPMAHASENVWLEFLDRLLEQQAEAGMEGQTTLVSTHMVIAQQSGLWIREWSVKKTGDVSSVKVRSK